MTPQAQVTPRRWLVAYAVTLAVFLAVDAVWLATIGGAFLASQLSGLLRHDPNLAIGFLFYLIFGFGLARWAVVPALQMASPRHALIDGALVGLLAYASFDLTNLAIMKGYPPLAALVDIVWGTALGAFSAFAGFHLTRVLVARKAP